MLYNLITLARLLNLSLLFLRLIFLFSRVFDVNQKTHSFCELTFCLYIKTFFSPFNYPKRPKDHIFCVTFYLKFQNRKRNLKRGAKSATFNNNANRGGNQGRNY
jgi:hypothetical protein